MPTLFEEDFTGFDGSGFDAVPASGQLDSDLWRVTGLSDGDGTFGGTHDTGDFARGSSGAGVSTGGVYGFDIGGGNIAFGFQPGGSDITPGTLTLAWTNDTGETITDLVVSYDIFVNNDQGRANTLNFAWSTDDTSYVSIPALDFTSEETADANGFELDAEQETTLSGLNLASGETIYLQWQTDDATGGGSRDEIAIDNVLIESLGPTTILEEGFETDGNGSRYTTSVAEFSDGSGDFFTRTDGSNIGSFYNVSGITGSYYFAGMDLDGEGASLPLTLNFDSIDISGLSELEFSIDLAEDDDGTSQDWDDSDSFLIEYRIDGGGWENLLAVRNDGSEFNAAPQIDTDFDGIGDGTEITSAFQTFTQSLTGTGSSLDIRLTYQLDSGDEDISIDNILLTGNGTPTPDTTPPTVTAFSPEDDGTLFDPAADISITFNETVAAGTGNIELRLASDDSLVEAFDVTTDVTISGSTVTIDPAADLTVGEDYYITIDSGAIEDTAGNDFAGFNDTTTFNFSVDELRIGDIQGSVAANFTVGTDDRSAFEGMMVTVTGVVVGDFQNGNGSDGDLDGFFIQDPTGDGDTSTSDGIFVYTGSSPSTDVEIGDTVTVSGMVSEYFGKTQISATGGSVSVDDTGFDVSSLVTTVDLSTTGYAIDDDGDFIIDLEAYEGMLIDFNELLTVTDLYNLGEFGEFTVSSDGTQYQFTQSSLPDMAGYTAHQQEVASETFIIDDGFDGEITSVPDWLDANPGLRAGSTVTDIYGVLDYGFDAFRLRAVDGDDTGDVTDEAVFENNKPAPTGSPSVGNASLNVVSFNVENFFTTLTSEDSDARGADNAGEYARQLPKIAEAILSTNADVVGLVEIEDDFDFDGSDTAIEAIVAELNSMTSPGLWAAVDPGVDDIGGDVIAQGAIYRTDKVQVADGTSPAILRDADLPGLGITDLGDRGAVFEGVNTSRNPLAVSFEQLSNGHVFTIAVNHFKSKGGSGSGANADQDDGAGNWNEVRTISSQAVAAWLATDPTGSNDDDFLILGDLNAYALEDPIAELEGAGYTNLLRRFEGLEGDGYGYTFFGEVGTLDYGLGNAGATYQTTGAQSWHLNADQARLFGYDDEWQDNNTGFFSTENGLRSADHDPLVVGLDLGTYNLNETNDIFVASVLDDVINALGGDDDISANAGNDTINGGQGSDTLRGGIGDDTMDGGADNDILLAGAGDDIVRGGGGDDVIGGANGNDTLYGGSGGDQISGGAGADLIFGGSGGDALFGGNGAGVDRIFGQDGDDLVAGGAGNDELFGQNGDDTIRGNEGDDTIEGGSGTDRLNGGSGLDTISGGTGLDNFVFIQGNDGVDTISDFEAGESVVLLGFGYADATAAEGDFVQTGSDVIFNNGTMTAVFQNALLADVTDNIRVDEDPRDYLNSGDVFASTSASDIMSVEVADQQPMGEDIERFALEDSLVFADAFDFSAIQQDDWFYA